MENEHVNGMDAPKSLIRVSIGASEYEPRWSFQAEYLLSTRNLTLADVLEQWNSGGKRAAEFMMELLSACIAHHFPAGAVPTAAALAAQVQPDQRLNIYPALLAAGRIAGAIVDKPKNAETLATDRPAPIELKQ